jgi:hypothetical protein
MSLVAPQPTLTEEQYAHAFNMAGDPGLHDAWRKYSEQDSSLDLTDAQMERAYGEWRRLIREKGSNLGKGGMEVTLPANQAALVVAEMIGERRHADELFQLFTERKAKEAGPPPPRSLDELQAAWKDASFRAAVGDDGAEQELRALEAEARDALDAKEAEAALAEWESQASGRVQANSAISKLSAKIAEDEARVDKLLSEAAQTFAGVEAMHAERVQLETAHNGRRGGWQPRPARLLDAFIYFARSHNINPPVPVMGGVSPLTNK